MPLTRRVQVYISAEASEALDRLTSRLGTQTAAIEYALTAVDDQVERSNGAATERTPDRIVATGPMIEPEPGRSYEINGRALENSLSPEAVQAKKKADPTDDPSWAEQVKADRSSRNAARKERKAALGEQARAGLKAITGAMPDFPEPNSLSPESKQKRNVVKAEKRERKAELQKGVGTFLDATGPTVESGHGKASVEMRPLERGNVQPIPKPGKK